MKAALDAGFARAATVGLGAPRQHDAFERWLERGEHGEMGFLEDAVHRQGRASYDTVLPGARSALVVLAAYDHRDEEPAPGCGRVARYAVGEDYHRRVKAPLARLGEELDRRTGSTSRACTDTAPILERQLAHLAGLGFVGKNTMLITPSLGSYTVIGELLTTAELAPTEASPLGDRCGECRACLDACPGAAFPEPYRLDARRCVSYLTIEHRRAIDPVLRPVLGDMVFGCDVCQEVCPYNRRAPARNPILPGLEGRDSPRQTPRLPALATLRSGDYRRLTRGSAMSRARRNMLRRNALLALGNSPAVEQSDPAIQAALEDALGDGDPVIREAAIWSLGQRGRREVLELHAEREDDPECRAALSRALSPSPSRP